MSSPRSHFIWGKTPLADRSTRLLLGALSFDLVLLLCISIWILGGISWNGHLYLRHGADPRRAALIVALLGYSFLPKLREVSFVIKLCFKFEKQLRKPSFRWFVYFACLWGAIGLVIQQTDALRFTLFDVGIFHQILWSLTHGFGFGSTLSGAGDFLQDHLSPSLSVLAPFFWASKGSPYFLPIAQVFLLFGGGAAWIYLAERIPAVSLDFRMKLASACLVFVLSFDSLWGNLRWGFHENAIAFCALSWAFTLFFTQNPESSVRSRYLKKIAILGLFLLAAGSKEILLLDVAFALICWIFIERKELFKKPRIFPFVLAGFSILLVVVFFRFEKMSHPADKNYFVRYYSYLGTDLHGFFQTLISAPSAILRNIGFKELFKYVGTVFIPWLFLPLALGLNRKRFGLQMPGLWIFAILPSFASAALSTYAPLRETDFHYVLELWPVLAVLTVLALARQRSSVLIWCWALFALVRMDHDPIGDFREFHKEAEQTRDVRRLFQQIPSNAAVSAEELAGPWVCGRQNMTRWPDVSMHPDQCPDLILVRFSERGTLVELGVQSVITRCNSPSQQTARNSDLIVPVPIWRSGVWSAYQVFNSRSTGQ